MITESKVSIGTLIAAIYYRLRREIEAYRNTPSDCRDEKTLRANIAFDRSRVKRLRLLLQPTYPYKSVMEFTELADNDELDGNLS